MEYYILLKEYSNYLKIRYLNRIIFDVINYVDTILNKKTNTKPALLYYVRVIECTGQCFSPASRTQTES